MFYLTSQEKKTVIFVLALLILGMGLDFLRKNSAARNFLDYKTIQDKLSRKIDINKAPLSELISIPGVSEQLAQAIIDYRKSKGNFTTIEELKNIKGIKDRKLEQFKKYITIESR